MAAKNLNHKIRDALDAHARGRIEEAENLYRDILKKNPQSGVALHHVGIIHFHRKEFDDAITSIRKSLAIDKNCSEAYSNLGLALVAQGKPDEAFAAYDEAIRLKPNGSENYNNLGSAFLGQGKLDEAGEAFCKAIEFKPGFALPHYNLGVTRQRQERLDEAIAAFHQAILVAPDFPEAYFNLGLAFEAQGKMDEAALAYQQAIRIRPQTPEYYSNLSSVFLAQQKLDDAINACRKIIELSPKFPIAYYNLGVALQRQGKTDEAINAFQQAVAIIPKFAEAYCNLGLALMSQGKLDEAVTAYRRAVECKPNFPEALNNLGQPLFKQWKLEEATEVFQQAIALRPDYEDAVTNLASTFRKRHMLGEAIAAYKRAIEINPKNAKACIELANLRRHICDWSEFDADIVRLFDYIKDVEPFILLNTPATAAEQLACSRRWAARTPRGVPFKHNSSRQHDRIRIGYLSADFRRHATAYLMAELFERHDRSRFEIFAYSYGYEDNSEERQRLINAFDHFTEARDMPHGEVARHIYKDEIDIVIDLKGYTGDSRTEILADRPAPVQVNYLGYPGTMGADFIDYIIADPFVAPMEFQPFYSEKIVHLPYCYQPNDTKRAIADLALTRTQFGLPEQGVVFCSFNGCYKISPVFFDIWMRLLKAVPESVLWLLATDPTAKDNLMREATARGVDPARVIFADPLILSSHLARHKLADLFLDTSPINAHTTVSDSLWAGLPVLTCAGEPFASRVAGSALHAVGLPELVTTSVADYEARAFEFGTNPQKLAGLKEKLARNLPTAPLFDIDRYTRHIETAYARMWDIWRSGKDPEAIVVDAE